MYRVVSYFYNPTNFQESEDKCFVCVNDGKVVGNIITVKMNLDNNLVPVLLPDWETFIKILESPNHQFIKSDIPVLVGTIWDGSDFIAPVQQVQETETINGVYIKINNSYIYHENNFWDLVREYTLYQIELLQEYLENNPSLEINIVVMTASTKKNIIFSNNNRIIYIFLNVEQTIIDYNTITLSREPDAKLVFNGKEYTVNMDMVNEFKDNDIIFDYSKPNIKNIEISGLYPEILSKFQYISPCIYKNTINTEVVKNIDTITIFSDNGYTPRREIKLQEINNLLVNHRNENNCFGDELTNLLENTKILINIHRTDDENTFEELRVLPALMQKVLVVSEISPLNELVPFNPLIIWSTYDQIVEKTKEVLDNYQTYYNQIFTEENIQLLNNLHNQNKFNINNKLTSILQ